jgi:DNA (cytosine-5)-methyltransferase 1
MGERPRLLDLFCGAGGAAMGYHRAGFEVVGVDIEPQPRYPFEFHRLDAMWAVTLWKSDGVWPGVYSFDAIHASPVCKLWSQISRTAGPKSKDHPDLITPLRPLLIDTGLPWVIENVPQAPLLEPKIQLCGSQFDLDVRRHRHFENNWGLMDHPWPCRHKIWAPRFAPNRSDRRRNPLAQAKVMSVAGGGGGGYGLRVADWQRGMGIDWMTRKGLSQAIPPAYTEFIGARLLEVIRA